jgi:hypothetical protein
VIAILASKAQPLTDGQSRRPVVHQQHYPASSLRAKSAEKGALSKEHENPSLLVSSAMSAPEIETPPFLRRS